MRAHLAVGAGNDVRLGMGEGIVESRFQPGFHAFGDQMLVVVGDPAQLGEGNLLRRRAGHFDHAVFDDEFGRFGFEIEGGELQDLLAQLGGRAMDRADVV
ncbi:hypothetical protein D3C83_75550 [compost metagenome]